MQVKDLSKVYDRVQAVKFPKIPAHARASKSYSDKTANGLTKCIIDCVEFDALLNGRKVIAQRSGNEGRYREGETVVDVIGRNRIMKGMYIPGHNKGMADLTIILDGRTYYVEVKIGTDRQSKGQKEFETKVTASGAVYVIVKTFVEFYNYYIQWIRKN